ncbi:MAG: acetyl-CoA carboxylase, carboxyltransferase subunit beta [Clostridia bacterium]
MLPKNLFKRPRNQLEDLGGLAAGHAPAVLQSPYQNCPGCRAMMPTDEVMGNLGVCPKCGYHFRMGARARIASIADAGTFEEMDAQLAAGNPLAFPEYEEKLEKARKASGEVEGVVTGLCRIGGHAAGLFVMEPGFMMGSMGTAVGEKITRLFERATEKGVPVVGFTVSGGARMQEGILSLMQMAKTAGAVGRHAQAGNLYVVVLTDPTTGGVMASFAMQADITLAEPGALIGFAGPRVIEQTIRQKLPDGFQRAEFLVEKGFVDNICARAQLKALLGQILGLHQREAVV